jgi:YjbE family integral membrane protein
VSPDFLLGVGRIVMLDLLLAGDNALVIALAVRTLPRRQQFLGRIWGTAGAVGLRLAFITIVTYLLGIPLLQVVGGLLLLWIAFKLLRQSDAAGEEGGHVRHGTTLVEAVWIIIVADVVMSLDNVIAVAGAAHGDLTLVVFGIGLSIPLVVWGSGVLARLMNRYPWIVWVGGGVLGEVAAKMCLDDTFVQARLGHAPLWTVELPLRVGMLAALTLAGWYLARRRATAAHPAR